MASLDKDDLERVVFALEQFQHNPDFWQTLVKVRALLDKAP